MLKIAIVGCGKVADQHVSAIHRIPQCRIEALCDREILMAEQLGERFGISKCFVDLETMLKTISPDVVHITSPPQSHYSLAAQCLAGGTHVYVEKPFAVSAEETKSLIQLAQRCGLQITVGHNYLFTHEMLEVRRLVREGFLGGSPVHLESYWSYDLGDTNYVRPMLGSRDHWVRRLPGQLLHNIISHGIAKLAEFLDDELTEVIATAHQSRELGSLGAHEVLDELRVVIRDKNDMTAFFCFSTQIKGLNLLRVFGPAGSLTADIITGSFVRSKATSYKSYLTYFVPPLKNAYEQIRNAKLNISNFVARRLYQDFGMKQLIERFYNSIRCSSPPPIPYREIILTSRIMDEVFAQIHNSDAGGLREKVTPQSQKAESGLPLVAA